MKKILFFIVAVISLTTFSSSQASAEMLMLTSTNGGSFTFDAMSGGDNLVTTNGDDGLNDIAFFLGYQTGGGATAPETELRALNSGSGSVSGVDTGTFTFDTVTFGNGVSVDAVANFRLVDATGSGLGHQVVYDLSLQTDGVSNATEGSLQSFVGFDFNGTVADIAQDNQVISGFGTSDVAIGSASGDRSLLGDFTFPIAQDGVNTIAATNSNFEFFNGAIGGNLNERFDGVFNTFVTPGDLAFGSFNDFLTRDIDQLDTTGGVVAFQSTANATIPEPSTLLMASMGLGMVAFLRRKRA